MKNHSELSRQALYRMLRSGAIAFGGNARLRIYGTLQCSAGKRLNMRNRVFFATEAQALEHGYRPCAQCMRPAYLKWKDGAI